MDQRRQKGLSEYKLGEKIHACNYGVIKLVSGYVMVG